MGVHRPFSWKKADLAWVAVSLIVLLPCLYYPYVADTPTLDFTLNPKNWKVISITANHCPDPADCLKIGDEVLAVGSVTFEAFRRDRLLPLMDGFKPNGDTTIRLRRGDAVRSIRFHIDREHLLQPRLTHLALFFPLIFWLMGTIIIIFLRPRDERWLVLVLFSYVTALWIASGWASARHISGSTIVFHVFIWFFLPLTVHLHTLLPNSLLERPWRLLLPLYGLSAFMMVLDVTRRLNGLEYVLSFLMAILLTLVLLVVRLFTPADPAVKVANRIMLYGVLLGFGPMIFFLIIVPAFFPPGRFASDGYAPLYLWMLLLTMITLPIMPMSYIYAIYKHHLATLEFRANRLLGVYSFASIFITLYVVVLFFVSTRWAAMSDRALAITLGTSLLFLSSALALRGRFQSLVDRHVFGIKYTPDEVIEIVSERIPTAFNRSVLAQVVVREILPTLMVRQSALYLFAGDRIERLYEQSIPPDDPEPTSREIEELLGESRRYLSPEFARGLRSWVRLAVPLSLQAETIGIWLIGRRDPDDFFPASDIHLLSTVANQIAPMVENIRLYERAQQEIAQRKAAEERFRTLFEATLEGIAIVRNGVILAVNQALLAIFGTTAEEIIGRPLSELFSDSSRELSGVPRECVGSRRDGTQVDIEVAGKKYVFEGEDVTVVAIRDIARRKHDEAENKMLQQQLLHSQKMEAIGRLSAGVAHDFNNCLLAIFGYSDLLRDRYGEDAFLYRNLTGIKEAGQKAANLTKQLLAFARRQPMESRVMDLNAVVAGLEKMLQRLLGEDISLVTDLHGGLGQVKIDPGQMEQVIVNLAVNARQAMPSGGTITIRTTPLSIHADTPAHHGNLPPGSYVLMTVADTGIGMEPGTQARIFEPFFSTKGEGSGLGLSTAYGIVKQSRGHIFVDSAPGQGACFAIYLPVTSDEEVAALAQPSTAPDTGSETILLVEDEDEARAVLHQILTGKGYRVFQASSGDEGLAVARLSRGTIHLLLTDVTMPRMKGTELAARLCAERPGLRVLFMSGYNEEVLPLDAVTCLQKPFSAQTLTQAVRCVLDAGGEAQARATA